jgi:signal transduction histidine kinase
VERLARDYSAVAAWSFHRFANASLQSGLEHLMHPVHPSEDGPAGPGGAGAIVSAHKHTHVNCVFGGSTPVRGALHFRLRGRAEGVDVDGSVTDAVDAEHLVQVLTDLVRREYQWEWMSALTLQPAAEGVQPLAYYARRAGPDTLVWGVRLGLGGLRSLFEVAAFSNDLLPPSLTGPMAAEEFLSLAVWTSDRRYVWGSRQHDTPPMEPMFQLGARWGGLQLAAVTLPEVAPRLAIGGPPPARLPVTIGLLLLAVGLLAVALGNVRKADELARLRSEFVSSVSHDLRTPLALQRISIDTLRLGRARDVAASKLALTNIDREATRLTHLVDNLLRFSRAETASTQLRLEPTDLGPVIETTVRVFSELIDPADAKVMTAVEVEAEVLADVDGLGRVLLNLLENAVKYGTAGQTVRVGLTRVRDHAVITVDDEGPGVEPSERHSIWEPFSRGVDAVRGAAAGSGIGLSVVREIITAHGGSARVLDAPGGGARFELQLPLTESLPRARQPDTRQAHV